MLRLSQTLCCAVAAVALVAGSAAVAQLAPKLDAQEQKLAQDERACQPINLGEYTQLLNEAAQNKQRAEKAKKKNVPVDEAQVNADLAKASALFNRAQAALVQQCMRAAQQQAQPKQTSMSLSPFSRDVLAAHNSARAAVGSPALKWNEELAAHAQARAAELAQIRQLVHAPREGRGTERENILQAPLGYSPGQMMERWTKERSHLVPGLFPNVSDTGNWLDVAHYTQMIWAQTTDIGCGYAPGGGFNWVVCRYDPGGNKDGKPVLVQSNSNSGFQVGAGFETTVTDANGPKQPDNSSLKDIVDGIRVRQDWGSQQIAEQARKEAGLGDEPIITWGADLDIVNKYIWRGFNLNDDPSLRPNLWSSAYAAVTATLFNFDDGDEVCQMAQISPGAALNYDLGSGLATSASPHYVIPIVDEADEGTTLFWAGVGLHYDGEDGVKIPKPVDTKVEQPDLGGLPEIFDPAAKIKDPNQSPCEM